MRVMVLKSNLYFINQFDEVEKCGRKIWEDDEWENVGTLLGLNNQQWPFDEGGEKRWNGALMDEECLPDPLK